MAPKTSIKPKKNPFMNTSKAAAAMTSMLANIKKNGEKQMNAEKVGSPKKKK